MLPRARFTAAILLPALALAPLACNEAALETPAVDAGAPVPGLSPELAGRVVAKVGDKNITLGDFARTLDRMDEFDRLRYQTKERRRELLNEIVDVELLAIEAKRRGLDKTPEVEEATRQILRDAILAQARASLPPPAQIPAEEVRAYYEAHQEKYREPERRRVAAIVLEDRKDAEKVLKAAEKVTTGAAWGELFLKHSLTAPKQKQPAAPVDLAGDLGVVGPPDDAKGANAKVPEPVRKAVFEIANVGAVLGRVVEADGKLFIVRMNGITAGHNRTLAESDRSIRIAILQDRMQANEKALEEEIRKKLGVQIDEAALAEVRLPAALDKIDLRSGASGYPGANAAGDAGAPEPQPADAGAAGPADGGR